MEFSVDNEDIHMNIETILTERIGAAGKRLHTGRSRNDQVAVDFRLYRQAGDPEDHRYAAGSGGRAGEQGRARIWMSVMPGYTHLQRAQPTTFAHYMMAYANMLRRDITRLRGLPGAHGRVPAGRRRAGRLHLSRRPVSAPPSYWASTSPPRTAWTPCPTATTPLSF